MTNVVDTMNEEGFTSPIRMAPPAPGVVDFMQLYTVYAAQLRALAPYTVILAATATETTSANIERSDADVG